MPQISIQRHIYHYSLPQRSENDPYLLMLHGFMGDHRVFDHMLPEMKHFCNPVVPDLLGFGQSSRPTEPAAFKSRRQVRGLVEFIHRLSLSPLFMYGYSMGGRLALQLALEAPELFQGIILESTNCGITGKPARKKRQQVDEQRAQRILEDYLQFLSRWSQLPLFASPKPAEKKRVQRYHRIQQEQNPEALAASLRGFGTGVMPPVCEQVTKITSPVVLLAGSNDDKYQALSKRLIQQFPHGHFTSLKGGHRLHLDNPQGVLKEIRDMIKKHDS